jgi:hypothetical protein
MNQIALIIILFGMASFIIWLITEIINNEKKD